jgi:Na+/citrate or Na+/malate symporter
LPFATGLLLPLSGVFIDLSQGIIGVGDIFSQALSALFRGPVNAIVSGALATFTGLFVGLLWGLGAWAIDRLNASRDPTLSRNATWAFTIALTVGMLLALAFFPEETLARLN